MGLVAAFTFGSGHVCAVRLVALGTQWNLAMDVMTEAAGQTGVFAFDLLEFNDLLAMATYALIGNIVGQLYDLWCVWVVMAA